MTKRSSINRRITMARYTSLDPDKYFRIRDAAIALFYKQGIENTSIQEIAKQADIAKGTVYLYFKSRKELVNYVIDYCFDLNIKSSMKNVDEQKNMSSKLKKRTENMLFWSQEFPEEASIINSHYRPVNIFGTESVAFSKSYEINKTFIENGINDGEFKKLPLNFLCTMFFSAVEGLTTYVKRNPEVLKNSELLEEILDTAIACIRN